MERSDICKISYGVSDMINSLIIVFIITIFSCRMNDNDFLGLLAGDTATKSGAIGVFIPVLVIYVAITSIGFTCRYSLKNSSGYLWPHITYLVLTPIYFITIAISFSGFKGTLAIVLLIVMGINSLVAIFSSIFGMVVRND